MNDIWKTIWALALPGKVKHFIWKTLKGVLPCFGTLANRHIPLSAQCPHCRIGMEDIQHCLFVCSRAMEVWSELGLKDDICRAISEDRSGSVTMEILCRAQGASNELPKAELIAVSAWYIWWQRRQFVRGVSIQSPDCTATSIKVLCTNFIRASSPKLPVRKREHLWRKPAAGTIKINVDASFCSENMSGATRAIARDDKGDVIAAASWFISHVSSVDSTEIHAVYNGIILALRIGCSSVVIESDSTNAVQIFNQGDEFFGPDAAIVLECKQLTADLTNVECIHCFREANGVADSLAKFSFKNRSSDFWESSIPDFVSHLIVNDLAII